MELLKSIRENTLGISIFAVVTAGVIAITQVSTQDTIIENERAQKAAALYEIIPAANIDGDLLQHKLTLEAPQLGYPQADIYQAVKNNSVTAVILPVIAPDGYSGDINLIVGIAADSSVIGVRVLSHKETPGLGDKIDLKKSKWILGFNGKKMLSDQDELWAVKKDNGQFDQFTGATITPRAVVNAVGQAIRYFEKNKTQLLTLASGVNAS